MPADRGTEVLRCTDLSVRFGSAWALDHTGLSVTAGEILALLGPSGSGKTTLLSAIAGSVTPAEGSVEIAGVLVSGNGHTIPPERRPVGMVFQNYALWPHLTVLRTVAYPMLRAGVRRSDAQRRAFDLLRQLDIGHLADRFPAQLSGGEQQRTGLARALARNAVLYLLDEPTAHLDTHLRAAFLTSVLERQRETRAAVVYATHDAAEALSIADRVAVLIGGRLVQLDTPSRVYAEPVSSAAAALTGSFGLVSGVVERVTATAVNVAVGDVSVGCPRDAGVVVGTRVEVLVRPDRVVPGGPVPTTVIEVAFRGAFTEYRLTTPSGSVPLHVPGPPRLTRGDRLSVRLTGGVVLGATDGRTNANN